jgi:hypothetical protein
VNCVVFRLPAPWAAGCTRCGTAPPETVCWTPPFKQPTASSTGNVSKVTLQNATYGVLDRKIDILFRHPTAFSTGRFTCSSRQPTASLTGNMSKAALQKATYGVLDRKVYLLATQPSASFQRPSFKGRPTASSTKRFICSSCNLRRLRQVTFHRPSFKRRELQRPQQ